jgi:hypothetical protein
VSDEDWAKHSGERPQVLPPDPIIERRPVWRMALALLLRGWADRLDPQPLWLRGPTLGTRKVKR